MGMRVLDEFNSIINKTVSNLKKLEELQMSLSSALVGSGYVVKTGENQYMQNSGVEPRSVPLFDATKFTYDDAVTESINGIARWGEVVQVVHVANEVKKAIQAEKEYLSYITEQFGDIKYAEQLVNLENNASKN